MKTCKLKCSDTLSSQSLIDKIIDVSTTDEKPFVRQLYEDAHIVTIIIVSEYYLRIKSTLSVTLIVDERLDSTTVEIIANGGGLMQTSYGAENASIKRMVKALKILGFEEVKG